MKFLTPGKTGADLNVKPLLQKLFPESEFFEFETEQEICELINRENPEIVFLDISIAEKNNFALCRKVKTECASENLVILVVSEKESEKNRTAAQKAGADSFIVLPIAEIELFTQINLARPIEKTESSKTKLNGINQLHNILFDAANDFVFLHHFDENKESGAGKFIDVSDSTLELLGYSREELKEKSPLDLTTDANGSMSDVSKRLTASGKLKFENILLTKKGKKIPVEFQARLIDVEGQKMVLSIGRDISERKRSMEMLKKSEERFHNLFNSSPVPQSSWHFNGKTFLLSDVNKASLKELGGNADSLIGKTVEEVFGARKDIIERFYFCLDKKRNIVFETEYLTNNSTKKTIIFTYSYVDSEFLLLHTEDITERKKAEIELHESEEKFRSLISEMDYGLAVHEAIFDTSGKIIDYRFIDLNECFERQTGLKRSKITGKTFKEILPDSENFSLEKYEEVVRTGKVQHFEEYSKALGKSYEVLAYRNQENQFATVISDITEWKQNIKDLRMHNARLEALTKILKYESEDAEDMLKFTLEQAVGLTDSEIGYIFHFDETLKSFQLSAWSGKVSEQCRVENQKKIYALSDAGCWSEAVKQKKPFIINDYSAPNKHKRGTPAGHVSLRKFLTLPVIANHHVKAVIGVANKKENYSETDVKQLSLLMDALWKVIERKQYNEQLLTAKAKAEESDRLKSAFLANMSHEIRTPMNGILGFVEMLKEDDITTEEREKYLNVIRKSSKRMLDTIDEIVDISRIKAKQIEVVFADVNMNELIDELLAFFKPDATLKGLKLEAIKSLDRKSAVVKTDKDKLKSVLMNLLNNALKYTNKGNVEFGYRLKNKKLQFFVKDTGIGIDENRQVAIFDYFVQADESLSRPYEGVGLGLSIAKAYVEILGGRLRLKSEKGKGSEFYFDMPYAGKVLNEEVPGEESRFKSDMLEDLTILVAEDDEVGRLYLQQLLESRCKKVLYAKNGKEAVEMYREDSGIDLVLMDIKMPVMDGYSATIKIKAMDPGAVIIAQTAYALSGDREKAIAAGCNDYLTKPLAKETLLNAIEKYLIQKI